MVRLQLALVGLVFFGCVLVLPAPPLVPPPLPSPAPPQPASPPVLEPLLKVFVRAPVELREGIPGGDLGSRLVLHSGDRVRFLVQLDAPGRIYLLGRSDQGAPSMLYAGEWPGPDQAGFLCIPPYSSFLLGKQEAVEDFFIFASRRPVSPEKLIGLAQQMPQAKVPPAAVITNRSRKRRELLQKKESGGTGGTPRVEPVGEVAAVPLGDANIGERNFEIVLDALPDAGATFEAQPGIDGLSYRRFSFRHSPAPPQP